ncbi:Kelch repeat and BTB domain-containing protein 2 [Cytospora mali]|uniref:Kelch repeat and BTB domain-containing protein 2 n=1 Tax=Cytospora mali TaxID=578113 RepID=A0A194UP60_CYTMA|nr:Kelch repeat and BTB domain-containing protein 2 [Valsa mali var. pyri (nom. inval.)]
MDPQLRDLLSPLVRDLMSNLTATDAIPSRVHSLLSPHIVSEDNQPFTEKDAMTRILIDDLGTDCTVDIGDGREWGAHKALLAAKSGYFRDYFDNNPRESRVTIPEAALSNNSGQDVLNWFLCYLYHPEIAGFPWSQRDFLAVNDFKILPCCVEVLRLGEVFQVAELKEFAAKNAQKYIDAILNDRFKANCGKTGPIKYLVNNERPNPGEMVESEVIDRFLPPGSPILEETEDLDINNRLLPAGSLNLGDMGVPEAIDMLLPPGTTELEDEQARGILTDIVLLAIGLKHRVVEGQMSERQALQRDLKDLCNYKTFRHYYTELDLECSAFRKEAVLYAKSDEVAHECACPTHTDNQENEGTESEGTESEGTESKATKSKAAKSKAAKSKAAKNKATKGKATQGEASKSKTTKKKKSGVKRSDIKEDSGRYVLLNPFDGGRTIYCWRCAGNHGYPWRPFRRLAEK